jgi:hypothetical protein
MSMGAGMPLYDPYEPYMAADQIGNVVVAVTDIVVLDACKPLQVG